ISIQVNDYMSLYVGAHNSGGTFVSWAGADLANESDCKAAWVRADLYRNILGKWTLVSSKQKHGAWNPLGTGKCEPPIVGWPDAPDPSEVLIANASYRIVATALTSPPGTTQKFRVRSDQVQLR